MSATIADARRGRPAGRADSTRLAASLTRVASKQTYAIIRLLADRDRVADAFRAYAYCRWIDDQLDEGLPTHPARAAFLARQRALLDGGYRGHLDTGLCPEEALLADLIAGDDEAGSGLRSYLEKMLAVMAFDVGRRGRLVSEVELARYTATLAAAVADGLFHFIGHDRQPPRGPERSVAVRGACVLHMLRDAHEDMALGYVNIPAERLAAAGLAPDDYADPAYRAWVAERVTLARGYLDSGRAYLAQVRDPRCRLAARAYIARFEWVARAIERDGYVLRPAYPERKSLSAALWMGTRTIWN